MNIRNILYCLALGCTAPLWAATPIDASHPLAADGSLHIGNIEGDVTVTAWDKAEVRITGSLGEGAKPFQFTGDAEALSVDIEAKDSDGGWLGFGDGGDMEATVLDVRMPRGASLDLDLVSADASVTGLAGTRAYIDSVSGDARLDATDMEVEVDTVSGQIRLDGSYRSAELESVSGDIDASGIGKQFEAETVSGDIVARGGPFDEASGSSVSGDLTVHGGPATNGDLRFESMSGDIHIILPAGASAKISAESFSGDIDSLGGGAEDNGPGPGSSLTTTIGKGEGRIHAETFSGDIRIESADRQSVRD